MNEFWAYEEGGWRVKVKRERNLGCIVDQDEEYEECYIVTTIRDKETDRIESLKFEKTIYNEDGWKEHKIVINVFDDIKEIIIAERRVENTVVDSELLYQICIANSDVDLLLEELSNAKTLDDIKNIVRLGSKIKDYVDGVIQYISSFVSL